MKLFNRKKDDNPKELPYYDNCRVLMLDKFERAYHGDLSALLKGGKTCDKETLITAWDKIQVEYCDLCADDSFKDFTRLRGKESAIVTKFKMIAFLLKALYTRYDEAYVQALKDWGFNDADGYKYDITNIDSYLRDLKRVENSLIHDDIQLKETQESIVKYAKKANSGIADGYFDTMLTQMFTALKWGTMLRKNQISTHEFGGFMQQLRAHYAMIEAENERNKKGK